MRRRIVIVLIFLLAGAVVNVAVAWGGALLTSQRSVLTLYHPDGSTTVTFPPSQDNHGWPLHCLASEVPLDEHSAVIASLEFGNEVLPLAPIWPGFAINTLFYTALLWLLIPGPFVLRRFIRRRRGLCLGCGYPMGESDVCTECGEALTRRTEAMT